MRFAIASDLHFEFGNKPMWSADLENCDVIVLAGDIAAGDTVVDVIDNLCVCFPKADVVWVAGNHEFYEGNIDERIAMFRKASAERPRMHFLENEAVEIGGCQFIGCTLWTGFDAVDSDRVEEAMLRSQDLINDFNLIKHGKNDSRFTPYEAARRFAESRSFLERNLANAPSEKTVVVTHFPPTLRARNMNFELDLVTAYFQANADSLIFEYSPRYWVYGHNHFNDDVVIGSTRVVSNQRGYPGEITYVRPFSYGKILTIETGKLRD